MSNIQSPVVIEIDYSSRTFNQLKETIAPKHSKLIFDYPTVYIVNDENKNKYSVYVGETTDIIRRTNQHLLDDIKKDLNNLKPLKCLLLGITISINL